MIKRTLLFLALAISSVSAQTVCGPNHLDQDGNPCANFTTNNNGYLVTNGPLPTFPVDSQDGVALTGDEWGAVGLNLYPGFYPPLAGVTLPFDPLVELGYEVISDGHLERIGTYSLTILGTRPKYPSTAPAPLIYVYTFDLNQYGPETLQACTNGQQEGFNWKGTLAVNLTFTGRYVCAGGRICVSKVAVYSVGTGVGEVSATPVTVACN